MKSRLAIWAFLVFLPLSAGCSLGYRNLHPGEDSALYEPLFGDVVTRFDEPKWLWVRGAVSGDFDADAAVDEEAVIATVQSGAKRNPGRIESAYLLICGAEPDGGRTPMARIKLFDGHPPPSSIPGPEGDACPVRIEPLVHARAQIIPDKFDLGDSVMVCFWGDSYPTTVWYACFSLRGGELTKTFEGRFWQADRGVATVNLDKRGGRDSAGYQLVFPVFPFPEDLAGKVEAPAWGHVYSPLPGGGYFQADALYGDHYGRFEIEWNEKYLEALLEGSLTPAELAWYEYHLGLLAHYAGKPAVARKYLDKALANSRDDLLVAAVEKAVASLGGPVGRIGRPESPFGDAEKP